MAERTPPTQVPSAASGGAAATAAPSSIASSATTGVQAALGFVDQLEQTIEQLKTELQGYTDPNVFGRDTILLRSYFDQSVGRVMQVARALKINWAPSATASGRR